MLTDGTGIVGAQVATAPEFADRDFSGVAVVDFAIISALVPSDPPA
jgi:hypothetical protein